MLELNGLSETLARAGMPAVVTHGAAAPAGAPGRCAANPRCSDVGGRAAGPLIRKLDHAKMPRGTVIETTQWGRSTVSLILRSPATLQMA